MTSTLLVLSVLLAAPDAPPAAEAAYKRGKQLYKQGDKSSEPEKFVACAQEFEKAYKLAPLPKYSYNAAQCHRRAAAPAAAAQWYRQYLADDPAASDKDKVEQRIAELDAELKAKEPPKEEPKPEKKPVDLSPAPAPAPAPAIIQPTAPPPQEEARPVYKKWWFWTAMVAVAGGATVGVILATSGSKEVSPPGSSLGVFPASFR